MTRTALVTGGTRGIGRSCAIALARAGYRVAAGYGRNEEAANSFASVTGIPTYRWNVAAEQECRAGVERIVADLGPIDVLVNNAGISPDKFLHKMTASTWRDTIETNLNSCFYMCQQVVPSMRSRKFGRIINITSVNAFRAALGETHYDAAKAGLVGFTKALALESARLNITVNAIAPGYIDTDMLAVAPKDWIEARIAETPVGRLGTPDDVGRCVVFLADDAAGFITGATLDVNGGIYLR